MSVLPIYIYGQSVLRKKAKPIKQIDDSIRRLADDMIETMIRASGIGLAANQVGALERILVIDLSAVDDDETRPPLVCVNPIIVSEEGEWWMEEGCLSIPDIREEVKRPEQIRLKYKDLAGNDHEIEADGLLGRVLLHEIDHLNGVLFFDRIGSIRRKLLRGRLNKIERGEIEVNYPIVAEVAESR